MVKRLTKFALVAAFGLALTFTLSCSGDDGDEGGTGGSSSPSGGGSTFKDTRDGTTYKTTKIGDQTWLAENLNYAVEGAKCYGEGELEIIGTDDDYKPIYGGPIYSPTEIQDNCKKYGRLYDWETAMTACPSDWRLPSNDDWDVLIIAVGGEETAGKYLKSKSGWKNDDNGEDKFGFSALPGGSGANGQFFGVGDGGNWWSSSEFRPEFYSGGSAYFIGIEGGDKAFSGGYNKSGLHSVRCVKD